MKYGCIFDKAFFEDLEKAAAEGPLSDAFVEQMIAKSAGWKVDVVNRDEREGGVRTLLNFGHTLGHAAEKVLGYGYVPHGVAVGVGMVAAAKLSEKQMRYGVQDVAYLDDIVDALFTLSDRYGTTGWMLEEMETFCREVGQIEEVTAETAWRKVHFSFNSPCKKQVLS